MSFLLATFPDESAARLEWLERQLVGPNLKILVQELEAIHGKKDRIGLTEVIGNKERPLLDNGLNVLGKDEIEGLLVNPRLLIDLQERICLEGGEYWFRVNHEPISHEKWERLHSVLAGKKPIGLLTRPQRVIRVGTAAVLGIVLVMLGIFLGNKFGTRDGKPKSAWGWQSLSEKSGPLTEKAYWQQLANLAEQWFDKQPNSSEALTQRLLQFRQGCSRLIFAKHEPLNAADRKWLQDRCQAWSKEIDGMVSKLEQGGSAAEIGGNADQLMLRLVKALRKKSAD